MRLKLLTPTGVLMDEEVAKVTAEAENGSFCLLPRHIDFVAALSPGVLSFESIERGEMFAAVDEGILVKQGGAVLVSVRRAAAGGELGRLHRAVEEQFRREDERRREARSAMARIEAGFVRRFLEVKKHG